MLFRDNKAVESLPPFDDRIPAELKMPRQLTVVALMLLLIIKYPKYCFPVIGPILLI